MTALRFLKTAMHDYKVGALTPSSQHTVQRVAQKLRLSDAYVIEYGAGDGVMTRQLLSVMPRDGRLVAIEANEDFLPDLNRIQDNRLTIIKGDVVELSARLDAFGLAHIDAVISGIPFSFLKPRLREEVARNTHAALNENGVFILYQVSLLMLPTLKRLFRDISWTFEPRNFPPYFIMVAKK